MLDPRIYRTGMVAVMLALIVFAFSLDDQPGGFGTSLAPEAFDGQTAYATMRSLAREHPRRLPGSSGDAAVAAHVESGLHQAGFVVSAASTSARTPVGRRTMQTIVGVRAGTSSSTILVLAPRDALRSPSVAGLSGTAVLLELARDLSGENEHHTIILASSTGSAPAAEAAQLVRLAPGPIDAALVLGDMAGRDIRPPLVVPYSSGQTLAPPELRNTVAGALGGQAGLRAGTLGVGGQLLHLAFPMTLAEQAPLNALGVPAVRLSLSGDRDPNPGEPTSEPRLLALGRAALASVTALDAGPQVSAPASYLVIAGKLIPFWAIRLLVLALILPVALATIDGVARARRRGHRPLRWGAWTLAWALGFWLAALVVVIARLAGLLSGAPSAPVAAGLSSPHAGGWVTMAIALVALVGAAALLRPWLLRRFGIRSPRREEERAAAAGAGLMAVLVLAALITWAINPFAAALLVPALHLWLPVTGGEFPLPRAVKLLAVLAGVAAPAVAVVYYALTTALSPIEVIWNGVLMIAGGQLGPLAVLVWSIVLGCVAAAVVLALRPGDRVPEPAAITVRGPVSYAGPGSLGGTQSALRR